MPRRFPRTQARAIARLRGRQRFPWFAWLVLATMLVIGAALGHADPASAAPGHADPASPAPGAAGSGSVVPLPPAQGQGFAPTSPHATPGQTLVPPPQNGRGGVIAPPASVDRGIAQPTPPSQAFPTPVIKPPDAPPR